MAIDGFDEILNTIYIAKMLYDMGKYEAVEGSFYDLLEYDLYYENMHGLIENIFAYYECRYYGRLNVDVYVLSDPVIADFYTLAGEYGKLHKIPDEINPYMKEAEQETWRNLHFSYCIDWKLMGHTEPKRPYHSRLGVFVCRDDWVDPGWLASGLIGIYEWFSDTCSHLRYVLHKDGSAAIQSAEKEAA